MTETTRRSQATTSPFLTASLGMGLLTGMDALVKGLSDGYPTFQIVFMRFAVTALAVGLIVVATRAPWPQRHRWRAHLSRAALMVVTTSSFFYALGRLPLAEVFALSFTSPIFTALFAALFLKEPLQPRVAFAIAAGFAGMLVIVFGGGWSGASSGQEPLALACAFLAPVTYALSIVLLRAQTSHEPITVIVCVQAALVALLLAPVMAAEFVVPTSRDWALFAGLGLLGSAGYLAFASGLKALPAARFSVVEYTGLIWAAALGYAFFGEVPRLAVWAGAALIIAGCLLVITRAKMSSEKPAAEKA